MLLAYIQTLDKPSNNNNNSKENTLSDQSVVFAYKHFITPLLKELNIQMSQFINSKTEITIK